MGRLGLPSKPSTAVLTPHSTQMNQLCTLGVGRPGLGGTPLVARVLPWIRSAASVALTKSAMGPLR